MKNYFNLFYNGVLNFVLPPICINCESPLQNNTRYLCNNCFKSIQRIDNFNGIVKKQLNKNELISNAYSLFLFQEGLAVQSLIHSLKYGQMRRIGNYYGSILANDVLKNENLNADFVIPVPLHISKKRERGYNQSDSICEGLAGVLGNRVLKKCLKRRKFTQTQTKLTREERQLNVKGAFELRKKYNEIIIGKNIIIVDDVITTGSTILECARVLKSSGCGKIAACSLALAE